jgi:ferredoxin
MYLLSIAEKLAQDSSGITFDTAKCARRIDRFSKCEICVEACPSAAIRLDKQIEFDAKTCASCGACLHLCPLGAFSGEDHAIDLFNCTPRLANKRVIQLICAHHPSPETGPSDASSTVRMSGCLASLGTASYLWLLSEGVERIVVRLDACASCEIGKVRSQISQTVANARSVLNTRGQSDRIVSIDTTSDEFKPVVLYDAKQPPLSRRDLFRSVAAQAPKMATQVMPMIDTRPSKEKRPPLERRRLINVLRRFSNKGDAPLASDPVPGIVRKRANQRCTACGACARICPTGALQFAAGQSDFRLTYSVGACTDCGACLDVCRPAALARDGMPTCSQFTASEPDVLLSGVLRVCEKCGAKFAGEATAAFCSICEFRQQNPFGGIKPEEMVGRLKR